MPRQLFTAEDIRRLARENSETLVLGQGDIITPEATDVAYALGVRVIRSAESGFGAALRRVEVSRKEAPTIIPSLPPLKVVRGGGVALESFGEGLATAGTNVRLKDVVSAEDKSPMAAGYMTLDKGEFPWTLTYDEVDIVLEGELVITRGRDQVRGLAGDVLFIPKGSSITFGTPSHTRFVYVAFPVNWSELK